MSFLYRVPPVYTTIGAESLLAAVWQGSRANESDSAAKATASLAIVYPGRTVTLVNSGTSALTLALQATTRKNDRGPCVALPAYACPDIGTAAIGAGFRIALYDVQPNSLEPDLESLRQCFVAGVSHVVVVHLFGRIVDVHAVQQLANEFGAVVIEDAAQHAGGALDGVRAGMLADWSVLSFGRGKGINAGGGGALMQSPAVAHIEIPRERAGPSHSIGVLAKAGAAEVLSNPWMYWIPSSLPFLHLGDTEFHEPSPVGEMSDASALLLSAALDRELVTLSDRRAAEHWYWDALQTLPTMLLKKPEKRMASGALRFPIKLSSHIAEALKQFGVARSYPRTLAEYHQIQPHIVNAAHQTLGASALAQHLYTLPTHSRLRLSVRKSLQLELIRLGRA